MHLRLHLQGQYQVRDGPAQFAPAADLVAPASTGCRSISALSPRRKAGVLIKSSILPGRRKR
eukprot:244758-Heterocapsa_arctica.AAC.1